MTSSLCFIKQPHTTTEPNWHVKFTMSVYFLENLAFDRLFHKYKIYMATKDSKQEQMKVLTQSSFTF